MPPLTRSIEQVLHVSRTAYYYPHKIPFLPTRLKSWEDLIPLSFANPLRERQQVSTAFSTVLRCVRTETRREPSLELETTFPPGLGLKQTRTTLLLIAQADALCLLFKGVCCRQWVQIQGRFHSCGLMHSLIHSFIQHLLLSLTMCLRPLCIKQAKENNKGHSQLQTPKKIPQATNGQSLSCVLNEKVECF